MIIGHDVFTVPFMGWKGVKNGRLLALAGADQFDALITTDAGIHHQQNLTALPIAVLIIESPSNDLDDLQQFIPDLLNVLRTLTPRAVTHIR